VALDSQAEALIKSGLSEKPVAPAGPILTVILNGQSIQLPLVGAVCGIVTDEALGKIADAVIAKLDERAKREIAV
jgi:hypothetical protein